VISALGVWTPGLEELTGVKAAPNVRASKGIHLVVPRDRIASDTGLILRTEKSVLFVIPACSSACARSSPPTTRRRRPRSRGST
jgi:glycerol-3-phosphate dehydrogenase